MSNSPLPTDPGEIAGKLTDAQRRVVLTNDRGFHPDHYGKWSALTQPTAQRLFDLGLIRSPSHLEYPTPLGLQVRAILLESRS